MGYNIEWADPEVIECWSFQGRLYRSYRKAQIEREGWLVWKEKNKGNVYCDNKIIPPIYKVKWNWEEVDGSVQ